MGAGRRTETYTGSHPPTSTSFDMPVKFLYLSSSNLGGVIFGCTHATINECLDALLFGLPYHHFAYIRNIQPGMPLFLFNYNDRKLHGVFEAASCGELDINPHAWTSNSARTSFPAQVRVRVRKSCPPLSESIYKNAISGNYNSEIHFSFELDKSQAGSLITLFTNASNKSSAVMSKNTQTILSLQTVHQEKEEENDGWTKPKKALKSKKNVWHDPVQQAQEDACFRGENSEPEGQVLNPLTESCLSKEVEGQEENDGWMKPRKTLKNYKKSAWHEPLQQAREDVVFREENSEPERQVQNPLTEFCLSTEVENLQQKTTFLEYPQTTHQEEEDGLIKPKKTLKVWHEPLQQAQEDVSMRAENLELEGQVQIPSEPEGQVQNPLTESRLSKEVEKLQQRNTFLEYTQRQMAFEIEALKSQITQLSQKLESYEMQNKSTHSNESASTDAWILTDILEEKTHTGPGEKVFMLGGNNGECWLETADAINPVTFEVTPLATMLFPRSYAAATVLMGQIYIFGGGDGESWFQTAEYYDNEKNQWRMCPSMSVKRGSLAGVTLGDRIYAIGGGDGQLNFSEMECYDFHLGMWMMSTSMLDKRFGVAAVELDGAIYAMGGFNDRRYLRSVERYDPREALWSSMAPLHHKRGSLSATVLDGKIYAIGGYDGANILSSVEVYEPRKNCWIEMESGMQWKRSYASAVTVGDSIYVFGGYNGKQYLQTVERYQEDIGWEPVAMVGKRGFHAGVVL